MGRIKSLMIKKAARQLIENEGMFNESFEHNKRILASNTMPSKPIRNKVAGYISRLITMEKEQKLKDEAKKVKILTKENTKVLEIEAPQN